MDTYTDLPRPLSILGIDVIPFRSYDHAVKCIAHRINTSQKTLCVAVNPEKVCRAHRDVTLQNILNDVADISICDSAGIVFAAKILHGKSLKRCTGVDLFTQLITAAEKEKWRVFLLGASPESNVQACSNLLAKYPNLRIVGHCDGYFQGSEGVVEQINASAADLLFVGIGSPMQELWLAKYRDRLSPTFCMGVGGTFDAVSGKVKRAPKIFRKTGTEGLFRFLTHSGWPMRVRLKRAKVVILFVWAVLRRRFLGPVP